MKIWKIAIVTRDLEFWKSLDWEHKTNMELSKDLGIGVRSFERKRPQYAPHTIRRLRDNEFWKNIDWSKANRDLIDETGYSIDQITKKRKQFAPETVNALFAPKNIDYSSVDWNKSDSQIAREMGVNPDSVSKQRKKRGISNPFHTIGSPPKHDWESVDWSKSNYQIALNLIEKMIEKYKLDASEISKHYVEHLVVKVSMKRRTRELNMERVLKNNPIEQQEQQELVTAISKSWYKVEK